MSLSVKGSELSYEQDREKYNYQYCIENMEHVFNLYFCAIIY